MIELLPFQPKHASLIAQSLAEHGVALDTSDTGTGKTFVSAFNAQRLGLTPVVFCPKSVIGSWRSALGIAGVTPHVVNYERAVRGFVFPSVVEVERHGKTIGVFPTQEDRVLFIFDEVHRCKGEKTLNTELLLAAARTRSRILMLSATAIESPEDMRGIGVTLGLFRDREFFRWKQRHGVRKLWHGHFGLDPALRESAVRRIRSAIGGRMHGMKISEIPEFPETFITTNLISLPEKLTAEAAARVQELVEEGDKAEVALVRLVRTRQAVELCKAVAMAERAADHFSEGRSVVAFFSFRESMTEYSKELSRLIGREPRMLHGETTSADRELLFSDFARDSERLAVIQLQAGGTGVSLHDLRGEFPRVSLISPDFSARNLIQALGRVHRAGGKTKSIQEIILADYPLELGIKKALDAKINAIETLTNADIMSSLPFVNETSEA